MAGLRDRIRSMRNASLRVVVANQVEVRRRGISVGGRGPPGGVARRIDRLLDDAETAG